MKTLAATILALTCSVLAASSCTLVVEERPSSHNAKITVLLAGKPQANVRLTVTTKDQEGSRSLVADSGGTALLDNLPVGTHCIVATAENNLRTDLCLMVSKQSSQEISSFAMNLFQAAPPPPSMEEQVRRAEKTLPAERVRKLDGVVRDPTGAFIPNAVVEVYKRGSYPQGPVAKLKTNQEGLFAAPLNPGTYSAIIQRDGFRTDLLIIEISPAGREGRIQKILQIGRTSCP